MIDALLCPGGDVPVVTITCLDWDGAPLGAVAVPLGEDAAQAVADFQARSGALRNKPGYDFYGWLPADSTASTFAGWVGISGGAAWEDPPEVLRFGPALENCIVKACYITNSSIINTGASLCFYTLSVERYLMDVANPMGMRLRMERRNGIDNPAPVCKMLVLRVTWVGPNDAEITEYIPLPEGALTMNGGTIDVWFPVSLTGRVALVLTSTYGGNSSNLVSSGSGKSNYITDTRGTPNSGDMDCLGYRCAIDAINDRLAKNGLSAITKTVLQGLACIPLDTYGIDHVQARERLKIAYDAKGSDLTYEEMCHAVQQETPQT